MLTRNFLREAWFYGMVGIIHREVFFRGFMALEKLKHLTRFKVVEASAIRQPCPRVILKLW